MERETVRDTQRQRHERGRETWEDRGREMMGKRDKGQRQRDLEIEQEEKWRAGELEMGRDTERQKER